MAASTALAPSPIDNDLTMLKLAREIAMNIQPLEVILKQYAITDKAWSKIQRNTRFNQLLTSEMEAWETALNTHERVKLKSAAMLEEWLPELNGRIHDREEALPAVIEAGKMLAKVAGLGERGDVSGTIGERFSITINMGAQRSEFVKDVTPVKTIEGDVLQPLKDVWGDKAK